MFTSTKEIHMELINAETPRDQNILLLKLFGNGSPPLIVVGEIIEMNGKTYHLCCGAYGDTYNIFKDNFAWDEKFTHWMPLPKEI
jgi:hypothetical protein